MRPTIQIYEGPDGSGKTFHVERVMAVARRNGLRSVRIHHAPPQDWAGEYTFRGITRGGRWTPYTKDTM
jgi:thymidylate kinase